MTIIVNRRLLKNLKMVDISGQLLTKPLNRLKRNFIGRSTVTQCTILPKDATANGLVRWLTQGRFVFAAFSLRSVLLNAVQYFEEAVYKRDSYILRRLTGHWRCVDGISDSIFISTYWHYVIHLLEYIPANGKMLQRSIKALLCDFQGKIC